MRTQAFLVIVSQLLVLAYAVWSVHHRTDRRRVPAHFRNGLHVLAVFSAAIVVLGLTLAGLSDGRRFLAVREIFELGFIGTTGAVVLALRILKGAPYDRR